MYDRLYDRSELLETGSGKVITCCVMYRHFNICSMHWFSGNSALAPFQTATSSALPLSLTNHWKWGMTWELWIWSGLRQWSVTAVHPSCWPVDTCWWLRRQYITLTIMHQSCYMHTWTPPSFNTHTLLIDNTVHHLSHCTNHVTCTHEPLLPSTHTLLFDNTVHHLTHYASVM